MGEVTVRPYRASDTSRLDALVGAHTAADPSYGPPAGQPGSDWLGSGVGACLTRFVAISDSHTVGHVAVGSVPPCPQRDLWISHLKKDVTLVEIRRGMVHPDLVGSRIGGQLTKTAVRWATERSYLPVAASVQGRTSSTAMMRRYGWEPCGVIDVDGYGPVTLWVPPTKIVDR